MHGGSGSVIIYLSISTRSQWRNKRQHLAVPQLLSFQIANLSWIFYLVPSHFKDSAPIETPFSRYSVEYGICFEGSAYVGYGTAGNWVFSILQNATRSGRKSSPSLPLLDGFSRWWIDWYCKNFRQVLAQREQCVSKCFPTVGKSLRCLPSWQLIIHFMNHFISQATYHLSRIAKRGVCYTKWVESCHNGKYYDHFSTIEKLLCGQCFRQAKIRRKLTI